MLTAVDDYPLIDGARPPGHLPRSAPHPAAERAGIRLAQPDFPATDLARIDARAAAPLAAVSVPDIYRRSTTSTPRPSCATSISPRQRDTWPSRSSPAAFSPSPADLSAAELATMFHIYFLGSSEGLIFDVANANFDAALWNPLQRLPGRRWESASTPAFR